MSEVWPPPPTVRTAWTTVRLRGGTPVRVRAVRLWGGEVLIDLDARVWCVGCLEFVDVSELSRRDNRHPVGIPHGGTMLLPMAPDGRAPREESVMDVEW